MSGVGLQSASSADGPRVSGVDGPVVIGAALQGVVSGANGPGVSGAGLQGVIGADGPGVRGADGPVVTSAGLQGVTGADFNSPIKTRQTSKCHSCRLQGQLKKAVEQLYQRKKKTQQSPHLQLRKEINIQSKC